MALRIAGENFNDETYGVTTVSDLTMTQHSSVSDVYVEGAAVEESTLPATNLGNIQREKKWRTQSGNTSVTLRADFGGTTFKPVDMIALLATNLTQDATWSHRLKGAIEQTVGKDDMSGYTGVVDCTIAAGVATFGAVSATGLCQVSGSALPTGGTGGVDVAVTINAWTTGTISLTVNHVGGGTSTSASLNTDDHSNPTTYHFRALGSGNAIDMGTMSVNSNVSDAAIAKVQIREFVASESADLHNRSTYHAVGAAEIWGAKDWGNFDFYHKVPTAEYDLMRKDAYFLLDDYYLADIVETTISDSTNGDNYLEGGVWFLAQSFSPVGCIDEGWSVEYKDRSKETVIDGGASHFDVKEVYRELSFPMNELTRAESAGAIGQIYERLGLHRPTIVIPYDTEFEYLRPDAVYGSVIRMGKLQQHGGGDAGTRFKNSPTIKEIL